ncbi:hypothetical protein GQ44DRAFT_740839 [Phaeosphaeriaceae sp. PMI808]|nr:hypothetical protein GQ44DRAFT_740839 [Phaeosphaeriaceae sp. PMI808]
MRRATALLLYRWHKTLNLATQSPQLEELIERRAATALWQKLSETSDVFFTISRALHDGFPVRQRPPFCSFRNALIYSYMIAKYTSRWKFYQVAARLCIINPRKDIKLEEVAARHHIDPVAFRITAVRFRRFWPLLH